MNQIELVTGLPNWRWSSRAQQEILMTGQELVDMSDVVWRVGNVAVAGFIYHSLTNYPWMWFVLAEGVTLSDLIDFRRLARKIPKGTFTAVEDGCKTELRFAEFYGFKLTGETQEHAGKKYNLMRKM